MSKKKVVDGRNVVLGVVTIMLSLQKVKWWLTA